MEKNENKLFRIVFVGLVTSIILLGFTLGGSAAVFGEQEYAINYDYEDYEYDAYEEYYEDYDYEDYEYDAYEEYYEDYDYEYENCGYEEYSYEEYYEDYDYEDYEYDAYEEYYEDYDYEDYYKGFYLIILDFFELLFERFPALENAFAVLF